MRPLLSDSTTRIIAYLVIAALLLVAFVYDGIRTVDKARSDITYRNSYKVSAERIVDQVACQVIAGRAHTVNWIWAKDKYNSNKSVYDNSGTDKLPMFPHFSTLMTRSSYLQPVLETCARDRHLAPFVH